MMHVSNEIKILITLVIIFLILSATSAMNKSLTTDEAAHHIPSGYVFLKTGDFVFATDSPSLARCLVGFPLLFMDIKLPVDRSFWARDDRAEFSKEFLFKLNREKVGKITFWARLPIIIISMFGGIFLFYWAKRRFDALTAIVSSIFYFLSPNIIAHSRLATTDIAATVFIMCSVLSFWDFIIFPSARRALTSGIFLGLAMMAKYSALLLLPVYIILLLGIFIKHILLREKYTNNIFPMFLLCLLVAFFILWAGYAFEYKPFMENVLRPEQKIEYIKSFIEKFPGSSEELFNKMQSVLYTVKIPLSSYLLGVVGVLRHGAEGARTYFMGSWSYQGHSMYYVLAFLIKTPIPIIISFFFGIYMMLKIREKRLLGLYLLSLIGIFVVMASGANLQLGLRYILPVYPLIFIISAGGLVSFFHAGRLREIIGISLVLWLCVSQFYIYPNYLSYFNEFIRGPENGHKYLREANIDWGQDLPMLSKYIQKNGIREIYLSYFGSADPGYYGIKYNNIPAGEEISTADGVYAVSVNYLESFKPAQEIQPTAKAGYSIFIYDLRKEQ
jgi:hypothetical protein